MWLAYMVTLVKMVVVVYNVLPSGHCLSQSDAVRKELGHSFWKRFQAIRVKMSLKSTYQSKRSKTGAYDKMLTIHTYIYPLPHSQLIMHKKFLCLQECFPYKMNFTDLNLAAACQKQKLPS